MPSGNIVKLDVGGTVFKTSKSTLTKFDGFFKTMLETDIPLEKDEHEAIFVDRDPKHFRLILNFMRDGDVELPDCIMKLMEIRKEAMYYLLDDLVELCDFKIPVWKQHKGLATRCCDEMESLITNSSKKAVIFAAYNSDIDTNAADKFSLIVDKYDHEIDIFSVAPSSAEYTDFYYLVDKKTKKREEVNEIQLEQIMKERYGIGN